MTDPSNDSAPTAEQTPTIAEPVPSLGVALDVQIGDQDRSTSPFHSPLRHHRRHSSRSRQVKETINAKSHYGSHDDDGGLSVHQIDQYVIKQEIGRGSFGSVHLAVDQNGKEFAVKEFSKSRLRKRAQSNLLRRPSQKKRAVASTHLSASAGLNSPLHRHAPDEDPNASVNTAFDLIKEEIAIMKKLDHPNVVSLVEVLDDPEEDSLYMVLEMCKKGVVMRVGLEDQADPYDEETCRCWFRDMCLGLEYLHAQGIIHRDVKPDNCLITEDDVLKFVDFGVSEMFSKESDMETTKSVGSPAFMPPELCVARHGPVSGRAADIWSMGVTLFCLRYGRIPFERPGMLDLYQAIRNEPLSVEHEQNEHFKDLIVRLLEKDPKKRITMKDIRVHPWVTKNGQDPLLSEEENCTHIIEEPTKAELEMAITGNIGRFFAVAKAVTPFKRLLARKKPELVQCTSSLLLHAGTSSAESKDDPGSTLDGTAEERVATPRGGDHEVKVLYKGDMPPKAASIAGSMASWFKGLSTHSPSHEDGPGESPHSRPRPRPRELTFDDHGRGHAHDPLNDTLFLNIGAGHDTPEPDDPRSPPAVCESPASADDLIYEKAYKEELDRIVGRKGKSATMFLTRRVDHVDEIRNTEGVIGHVPRVPRRGATEGRAPSSEEGGRHESAIPGGFAALVMKAREAAQQMEGMGRDVDEGRGQ